MNKNYISASIVVGQTTSNPIVLNYDPTFLIVSGSVLTATSLTFLVSHDGASFYPLYDESSSEIFITGSKIARAYKLDPTYFWGWKSMKIVSGTSASGVAQATYNALFTIVTQPI